jgi:hypothetical protein
MAKTLVALIAWLSLLFPAVFPAGAAQIKPEAQVKSEAQAKSASKKPAKPAWSELTPGQQQVLAPFAPEWDQWETVRRKKWVGIADRYSKMKPAEQQLLQKRMQEWAKLSPAERKAAREKYLTLKKLPPEQRKQVGRKWQEYQQSRTEGADAPAEGAPQQ